MRRKLLVADLLCGAGGSSTGCARALRHLGLEMELVCVNHSPVSIETHAKNHPQARHYCQDIATVRPHLIVPEGYLDLLMASPTCTHHSFARGGKPTSDQERSDPWHIITWLTELRVKRMIIENVWEFTSWGPVDPRTGKPIKARKGEYFNAWIDTIRRLGFEPEWRKLNAADFGDATTRQRFILMARSDRRPVSWPIPTHRKREDGKLEFFPGTKPWKPAREIIDWSIKGKSIINRPKPLAPKTLARIYAGALKFSWPQPFIDLLMKEIERSLHFHIDWAFRARNISKSKAKSRRALVRDLIARLRHFRLEPAGFSKSGKSATPMLVTLRRNADGRSVELPIPALAASGTHIAVAEPIIINGRRNNKAKGVTAAPLPTLDTKGGVWLAEPFVMAPGSTGAPRNTDNPLPTITTGGAGFEDRPGCARPMLVEPFIMSRHSEGAPRAVGEPTPTQVAKHSHCLISPYYGRGSGETCQSAENPLPTVTSKGRFGMVVPVTNGSGGPGARSVEEPVPTITTAKGGEFAIVMPVTHHDTSDRVRDTTEPLSTITGANRGELAFIEASPEYDILFRMLEPHELAAAMGFNSDDVAYEFAGTKTEKIKQIGNAVSVAKMKACVGAIMADAATNVPAKQNAKLRATG